LPNADSFLKFPFSNPTENSYTIIQVKYNEELMARTVVVMERRDKFRAGMCPP